MFGVGWQEIIFVVIIVLVIFGGAKKMPGIARSIGKSFREFKKALKDVKDDVVIDDDDINIDSDEPIESISNKDKSEENV